MMEYDTPCPPPPHTHVYSQVWLEVTFSLSKLCSLGKNGSRPPTLPPTRSQAPHFSSLGLRWSLPHPSVHTN